MIEGKAHDWGLGPVDLSSLFLQQFVGFLYKAEPMQCGYSTWVGENAVERVNKCCPSGLPQHIMLFVGKNLLRWLGFISPASIKMRWGEQNLNCKDQQALVTHGTDKEKIGYFFFIC